MDTRGKIVNEAQARRIAASGATVVRGYFDPMTAAHAVRLKELKREGSPLLVLIATPPKPILDPQARAQLVAGLAVVNHVGPSCPGLEPDVALEQEDEGRLQELVAHVHARQKAAS